MKSSDMNFASWRKSMKLTQQEAANVLGLSRRRIADYESRNPSNRVKVPYCVALACSAISAGLTEWKESHEN